MLPYPTSLPYEDIMSLVNDIRSGEIQQDKARFVKSIWELAGYAAGATIGEPGMVLVKHDIALHMATYESAPVLSTEQVLEHLELYAGHARQGYAAAVAVPWLAILKWALTLLLGAL